MDVNYVQSNVLFSNNVFLSDQHAFVCMGINIHTGTLTCFEYTRSLNFSRVWNVTKKTNQPAVTKVCLVVILSWECNIALEKLIFIIIIVSFAYQCF